VEAEGVSACIELQIDRPSKWLVLVTALVACAPPNRPNEVARPSITGQAQAQPWVTSYQPPRVDPSGKTMTCTEVMSLREYGGQLWAAPRLCWREKIIRRRSLTRLRSPASAFRVHPQLRSVGSHATLHAEAWSYAVPFFTQ
jgi:hypothetical protein